MSKAEKTEVRLAGYAIDPAELHIASVDPLPEGVSEATAATLREKIGDLIDSVHLVEHLAMLRPGAVGLPTDRADVFASLVASIQLIGVKVPIIVRTIRYTAGGDDRRLRVVVDGRTRTLAAREANRLLTLKGSRPEGLIRVGCMVDDTADDRTVVVTGGHRRVDSPMARARTIEAMRARKRSSAEILACMGGSKQNLSAVESLLKLPPEIQEAVESGALGVSAAYEIARLEGHDAMRKAWGIAGGVDLPAMHATIDPVIRSLPTKNEAPAPKSSSAAPPAKPTRAPSTAAVKAAAREVQGRTGPAEPPTRRQLADLAEALKPGPNDGPAPDIDRMVALLEWAAGSLPIGKLAELCDPDVHREAVKVMSAKPEKGAKIDRNEVM